MEKRIFSFLGKPNSGKTTLTGDLKEFYNRKYSINVLSGSKLIRGMKNNPDIWQQVEPIMERGDNIPHQIMVDLLLDELNKNDSEILCIDSAMPAMEIAHIFDSKGVFPIDALITPDITKVMTRLQLRKQVTDFLENNFGL